MFISATTPIPKGTFPNSTSHSSAWFSFTCANMIASLALTLGGVFFLQLDWWIKGYLLMGFAMLVSSTPIMTKTVQESTRLVNKLEEARTEKLLASIKS
jgi:hypothetical protein